MTAVREQLDAAEDRFAAQPFAERVELTPAAQRPCLDRRKVGEAL